MLQQRERKIIQVLLNHRDKKLTTNELALQLSVSSKTIRKDIKNINHLFEDKQSCIQTKKGQGVWLDCDESELSELSLLSSFEGVLEEETELRKIAVLFLLFNEKDYISVEKIGEACYASSSTVLRDLDELQPFFKKHRLTLKKEPRLGVKVIGEEISLRIARAETVKKEANLNQYVDDFVKIQGSFPEIDITKILSLVEGFQRTNEIELSDVAVKGLIIHIAISLQRLSEAQSIRMQADELEKMHQRAEWHLAAQLAKRLSEAFQQTFDESETGYLTIHLMGANLANQYETQEKVVSVQELDSNVLNELQSWTKQIDGRFGTCLLQNERFISGMLLHLKPLLNRLKYNISITNPWTREIKQNYPRTFEIAVEYSTFIKDDYQLILDEDEISYLAMHIGPALDEYNKTMLEKVQVLIVCASGMGTSQFLRHKLEEEFSQLEILKIVSSFDPMIQSTEADLIISTVPLAHQDERIVYVSPVLNAKERSMIERRLSPTEPTQSKLLSLLSSELVLLALDSHSVEEVITAGGRLLMNKDFVSESYIDSALEREKLSSTAIGNLIAIPHAYQGNVLKQGIAILQLKQPIVWGVEKVQLVFLLALDTQSQQIFMEIFEELAAFTKHTQRVQQALNTQDADALIRMITTKEEFH